LKGNKGEEKKMISAFRSRWAILAVAAIGAAGGAIALGTIPASSASPVPSQVQITNTPLPVSGTVNVGNLPATQNVGGTVNIGNLPATQNVGGTVNIGNLPATQPVSGTVAIDPAHNQVHDNFTTVAQQYSGVVAPQQTVTVGGGPIDVSAYKEMTVVAGSDGPATVTISDAASGWILDSFTSGLVTTTRHYDFLPASVQITVYYPVSPQLQYNVELYLRGN
jgi:hypothetical protein